MLLLIAIAMFCGAAVPMQSKLPPPVRVIQFSGYRWNVRPAGVDGPGPNQWDPQNVRLDPQGRLHLKITRRGGVWCCAEVWTQKSFGFGHYQFQVTGLLDRLDPNVVLGLFNYPPESVGPDGTNEIDIEYSRWGNAQWFPASDTVYPALLGPQSVSHGFAMPAEMRHTTQRFDWEAGGINFQCLRGDRNDDQGEYAHWSFHPSDSRQRVPQQPLPVHINLWLVNGKAPQNGQSVELIINRFTFRP
jgi:hypothetical protein